MLLSAVFLSLSCFLMRFPFFITVPSSNALSIIHPLCGILYLLLHSSLSSPNYLPVIRFAQTSVLFGLPLLHLFCLFRFKLCVSSVMTLTGVMTMTVKPSVLWRDIGSATQSFRNASGSTLCHPDWVTVWRAMGK